jgi:hypothetical protein
MDLLTEIGTFLPPFKATFYSEDGSFVPYPGSVSLGLTLITVPFQFFSYDAKDIARKAAQSGR